jgi:hypothetical protein
MNIRALILKTRLLVYWVPFAFDIDIMDSCHVFRTPSRTWREAKVGDRVTRGKSGQKDKKIQIYCCI